MCPKIRVKRCCDTCQFNALEKYIDPCKDCLRNTFRGEFPRWKYRYEKNPEFDRLFTPRTLPRYLPWEEEPFRLNETPQEQQIRLFKELNQIIEQRARSHRCDECKYFVKTGKSIRCKKHCVFPFPYCHHKKGKHWTISEETRLKLWMELFARDLQRNIRYVNRRRHDHVVDERNKIQSVINRQIRKTVNSRKKMIQ